MTGEIEIRLLPSGKQLFSHDYHEITQFIGTGNGENVYFGVCSRKGRDGSKDGVNECPALWVDLDFKDFPGEREEALHTVKNFRCPPTIIIYSGHGYHCYWFFKEAEHVFQIEALKVQIESVLRGLAAHLNGDKASAEMARILRAPGTKNWKNKQSPMNVSIEEWNGQEYNLSDFEDYADVPKTPDISAQQAGMTVEDIISECSFLKYAFESQEVISEPLWYASISNLSRLPGGVNLCHDFSRRYPRYNPHEVEAKIIHALKDTGPHTCGYVKNNGFTCPDGHCKAKAPLSKVLKKTTGKKEQTPTQAELLIAIGCQLPLFHDDTGGAHAELNGSAVKVRSSLVKQYLSREMWNRYGKAPNSDSINQALNVLEAKASFEGERRALHNRVAECDGYFWYDLANGKAVRIGPGRWEIVDNPPRIFRRYSHQREQEMPRSGHGLDLLFKFVNIPDDDHRLLLKVWFVSLLVPDIGHPVIHPYGEQGSGKTTMCRYIKALIDPSKVDVFLSVTDRNEATQILEHHYFVALDNMSDLPNWLSDLISQAVTGAGISKRKLYTDDEDIIFQIKRAIAIGGIGQIIHRPDTMDRSILFKLKAIGEEQRIPDQKLTNDFERIRPFLLGAAFDVLAKAMTIHPSVQLKRLPRMADFTVWGCAIAEAMGIDRQTFLDAYKGNIGHQHKEIIGGNTLAQTIIEFMNDKDSWEGTVGKLYEELKQLANPQKNDQSFPKAANKLRHAVGRINLNLIKFGIKVTFADYDTKKGMPVKIEKISMENDVGSMGTVSDRNNLNDIGEGVHSSDSSHQSEPFWNSDEDRAHLRRRRS